MELPKLVEEDGFLQSKIMEVEQALNIVGSCSSPFPGAFVRYNGHKVLRIWRMHRNQSKQTVRPGSLLQNHSGQFVLGFVNGSAVIDDFEILENRISTNFNTAIEVQ